LNWKINARRSMSFHIGSVSNAARFWDWRLCVRTVAE
jgi:hypothetical protein